jgi:hypothetical protein
MSKAAIGKRLSLQLQIEVWLGGTRHGWRFRNGRNRLSGGRPLASISEIGSRFYVRSLSVVNAIYAAVYDSHSPWKQLEFLLSPAA